METDWEMLLMAFLHDPSDKALCVKGHEAVTQEVYLPAALGRPPNAQKFKKLIKQADRAAAAVERFPFPKRPFVDPEPGGILTTFHPVSAAVKYITCGNVKTDQIAKIIKDIVTHFQSDQQRFLALWRLLPGRIVEEMGPDWAFLPAETRQPDHTLWHHVDIATALAAADREGGRAFLSLTIGPVQEFIATAWSLRDLFTGSTLLSWLTFQAMRPVLEACGPTALVFPHVRGNFLVDRWLQKEKLSGTEIPELNAGEGGRPVTGLPNRFLALVPAAGAEALGRECEQAVRDAWKSRASAVRKRIHQEYGYNFPGWDNRWDEQIATLPDVSWVAVQESQLTIEAMAALAGGTVADVWPDAAAIRQFATKLADTESGRAYFKDYAAGRWQAQVETVAKVSAAARQIRRVPALPPRSQEVHPDKCTILGSFDQMGPVTREKANSFWEEARKKPIDGVHIRKHERLCAISLSKRFALPCGLDEQLAIDRLLRRFPDTATIAARRWLDAAGIDPEDYRATYKCWHGQWLHGRKDDVSGDKSYEQSENTEVAFAALQKQVKEASKCIGYAPPGYYAILMADGDQMGEWLAGRKAPQVREILHPKLVESFESRPDSDGIFTRGLNARRPVGPALHAAISAGLQHFASVRVPDIITQHDGVLVYSGGDDVLALMPVETALACAAALRTDFSSAEVMGDNSDKVMRDKASLSIGLAVVHTLEDLRTAIQMARDAEKHAKSGGRNQLGVAVSRRSGEKGEFRVPWTIIPGLDKLRKAFFDGLSDRWVYHLRTEATTLDGLSQEVQREVQRKELRRLFGRGETVDAETTQAVLDVFDQFAGWENGYTRAGTVLSTFATICQAASFFARTRDE